MMLLSKSRRFLNGVKALTNKGKLLTFAIFSLTSFAVMADEIQELGTPKEIEDKIKGLTIQRVMREDRCPWLRSRALAVPGSGKVTDVEDGCMVSTLFGASATFYIGKVDVAECNLVKVGTTSCFFTFTLNCVGNSLMSSDWCSEVGPGVVFSRQAYFEGGTAVEIYSVD